MTLTLRRIDGREGQLQVTWSSDGPGEGERVALRAAAQGVPTWLIMEEDIAVGACGLHAALPQGPKVGVEIGYGLVASSRGRGRGREAVNLLLAELRRLDVAEVIAEVEVDGPDISSRAASRSILESLDFDDLGEVEYPKGRARRFRRTLTD